MFQQINLASKVTHKMLFCPMWTSYGTYSLIEQFFLRQYVRSVPSLPVNHNAVSTRKRTKDCNMNATGNSGNLVRKNIGTFWSQDPLQILFDLFLQTTTFALISDHKGVSTLGYCYMYLFLHVRCLYFHHFALVEKPFHENQNAHVVLQVFFVYHTRFRLCEWKQHELIGEKQQSVVTQISRLPVVVAQTLPREACFC